MQVSEKDKTAVHIPTPLRTFTAGKPVAYTTGETVDEVLRDLTLQHPALKPHLYDESGNLRSFVNIYVNDEDVRYIRNGDTAVGPTDALSIVPSIAGGGPREPSVCFGFE